MKLFVILLCWQMALLSSLSAQESSFSNGHFDLSGELELEQRTFLNNPLYDKQKIIVTLQVYSLSSLMSGMTVFSHCSLYLFIDMTYTTQNALMQI